ncbi:MAG: phospholipase D-like domain-containing protein [Polaromonas sp.]
MTFNVGGYPFAVLAHFSFVLAGLLIYAIGTHLSGQRRHPSAALAWVLTIALLPYVGLPLYLVFGTRKFARPPLLKTQTARQPANGTLQGSAMATLEGMGLAAPAANRSIRFHRDGATAWKEFEQLARSASSQLDICTYVLGDDTLGHQLALLLQNRASAGVRIRLLLDALGSWRTSAAQVRTLREAGVEVRWHMPLLRNLLSGRGNLRNHRKLTIADSQRLWTGGRNLAAEYFTGDVHSSPWTDLSFTIDGPLAEQAQALFDYHWHHSHGPGGTDQPLHLLLPGPGYDPAQDNAIRHLAQMIPSGPDQGQDTFYGLLLTAIFRAEKSVLAVTPYFVPDDALLTALCLAARRGVRVELVVPERSNHRLADLARARALRDLAAAGGRIRLAKGMVHAKALVIDDALALCGSLNLDSRSLFLNFELMVAFYDQQDITEVTQWMSANFGHLQTFTPRPASLTSDVAEGLVRWLGFQI